MLLVTPPSPPLTFLPKIKSGTPPPTELLDYGMNGGKSVDCLVSYYRVRVEVTIVINDNRITLILEDNTTRRSVAADGRDVVNNV